MAITKALDLGGLKRTPPAREASVEYWGSPLFHRFCIPSPLFGRWVSLILPVFRTAASSRFTGLFTGLFLSGGVSPDFSPDFSFPGACHGSFAGLRPAFPYPSWGGPSPDR
jgi:hypothetical protein